jgi:MYXO-CTERM domain-containing protein
VQIDAHDKSEKPMIKKFNRCSFSEQNKHTEGNNYMKTTKIICGITLTLICNLAATLKAQNIYVEFANFENYGSGAIGEYGLNGSTVNASLISGLDDPQGLAISGNDLFFANLAPGYVEEYKTSGATVNASLISGLSGVSGIAISGNNVFVDSGTTVGEYTTGGATVNASLISGLYDATAIAISPAPEPSAGALAALGAAALWLWHRRK